MTTGATTGPVNLRNRMRGTPTGRTRISRLGSMVATGTTAATGRGIDGASPSRAAEETSVPTAGPHGAAVYSLRASSGWRTTPAQSAAGTGRRLEQNHSVANLLGMRVNIVRHLTAAGSVSCSIGTFTSSSADRDHRHHRYHLVQQQPRAVMTVPQFVGYA
jgi:hypothetical protein